MVCLPISGTKDEQGSLYAFRKKKKKTEYRG